MADFYNNDDPALSYLPLARKRSAGGALSQKNADDAFKRFTELSSGTDDYSQAQLQAIERSRQANMDDSLAIAAQYAGPKFAGMQDSYLKRAMAGREPTRVGNVMIGPDGTVVSDPAANRTKQAELQLRLGQYYSQEADRDETRASRIEQQDYDRARDRAADADKAAGTWTTNYGKDGSITQVSTTGELRTLREPKTNSSIPDVSGQSALIIRPDVDMSEAAGLYGRFVRTGSQIGDTVGLGNPD